MIRLISHITLSALLLLSATGMTINMHYCHDQLVDLAIMAPAESCCGSGLNENHANSDESICNSGHCVDETVSFESTSDYVVSIFSINLDNDHSSDVFYSATFIVEYKSIRENSQTDILDFRKPPTHRGVVLSEIQTFLI